jgi:hypothetical protein
MGLVGASIGLGFVFGPVVGAVLSRFGLNAPAFASAALAVVNLALAYRLLPETRVVGAASTTRKLHLDLGALRRAASWPNVPQLLALSLVVITGFAMMEFSLGFFIERTWVPEAAGLAGEAGRVAHTRAAQLTGWILFAVGIASAVVQGGLIGRLNKALGERVLIRAGIVITAAAFLLIPVVGPWMDLAVRSCSSADPCGNREGINNAMIITGGVVQGAGVLMALGSLIIPETPKNKPSVAVSPVSFGAGAGVGAVGRF